MSLVLLVACAAHKPIVTEVNKNQTKVVTAPGGDIGAGDQWAPSRRLHEASFEFDRSRLTKEAAVNLTRDAVKLRRSIAQDPGVRVRLVGHCDPRGSERYNIALGWRRAEASRSFLEGAGVPPSVLATESRGESDPACSEETEECWARDRRVVVEVLTITGMIEDHE